MPFIIINCFSRFLTELCFHLFLVSSDYFRISPPDCFSSIVFLIDAYPDPVLPFVPKLNWLKQLEVDYIFNLFFKLHLVILFILKWLNTTNKWFPTKNRTISIVKLKSISDLESENNQFVPKESINLPFFYFSFFFSLLFRANAS